MSKYFIIDRRLSSKDKSVPNRAKFLKRIESQIKDNIPSVLNKESIKDIEKGSPVNIIVKGIDQPYFIYDTSVGVNHRILPGNPKEEVISKFDEGDEIEKPQNGKGKGKGKGSNGTEVGQDEFVISISRDEFLKYFFDDLELPEMAKKSIESVDEMKMRREGYRKDGVTSNMDLVKSFKKSLSRRIGMSSPIEMEIKSLENLLNGELDSDKKVEILDKIELLKSKLKKVPFLDDSDLMYRRFEFYPSPSFSAVMFCIMDISGSMSEKHKTLARQYYTLLYLFLSKQYPKVDIVYIQHHTKASEVSEEEFFNSRENGGTIVLPSLELCKQIIDERYSSNWNIYVSTASDGDTWSTQDGNDCYNYMKKVLIPISQYVTYSEILTGGSSDLWRSYMRLKGTPNFAMSLIETKEDVWKVFRKLFEKKSV